MADLTEPTTWQDAFRRLPTDRLMTCVTDLVIMRQRAIRNRQADVVAACNERLDVVQDELTRRETVRRRHGG